MRLLWTVRAVCCSLIAETSWWKAEIPSRPVNAFLFFMLLQVYFGTRFRHLCATIPVPAPKIKIFQRDSKMFQWLNPFVSQSLHANLRQKCSCLLLVTEHHISHIMAGNIFRLSSKSSSGTAQHLQTETITDSATKAARGGRHRKTEAWKENEDTMKCSVDVSSFMRLHACYTKNRKDLWLVYPWKMKQLQPRLISWLQPRAIGRMIRIHRMRLTHWKLARNRKLYVDVRTGHQNICISQNLGGPNHPKLTS